MLKIEKLMNERGLKPAQLVRLLGHNGRLTSLNRVLNGETDISALSFDLLVSFARGLGVSYEDLFYDFELDGTASQLNVIKKLVGRIYKTINKYKIDFITDTQMAVQVDKDVLFYKDTDTHHLLRYFKTLVRRFEKSKDFNKIPSFALLINTEPLGYESGGVANLLGKSNYELLNSDLDHSQQEIKSIIEINNDYFNEERKIGKWNKIDQTSPLLALDNRELNRATTGISYTRMRDGGDLKVIVSVFNNEQFFFTEIYGVEWIEKEDQKDLVYYKTHYDQPFNSENILTVPKEQISEFEFNRASQSQFPKLQIPKL